MRQFTPHASIAACLAALALVAGSSLYALSPSAAQADDAAAQKSLFDKRCGGCHSLDRDKEGPRLGGVYGRTAGSVASFPYSEALKRSNVVWADDTLNRWLIDTEKLVPIMT